PFSNYCYAGKPKIGYSTINECFDLLKKDTTPKPDMTYVYIPHFDDISHQHGINSPQAFECFTAIDYSFRRLVEEQKNSDTLFIVTADHGLIDTLPEEKIHLDDYPDIKDCLILPLCGDPRVAYCYVRSNKIKRFRSLVDMQLNKYCDRYSLDYLIEHNYYGLKSINPRFYDRVGEEVLILKGNYVLYDSVYKENFKKLVGFHGGTSRDEMLVPLILV
ncbi:MAG: alkaline phosphatase family protein, partial [Candidatus Cloacimonetes bacterium]|nr:alkaline phosphatase family protein [Candidatus Cloacimonadota bacterium]